MDISKRFEKVYRPLVNHFVEELATRPADDFKGIPHLFLPAWGKNYHHALIRVAIVGKETHSWHPNLDEFIPAYQKEPYDFEADRKEFQNLDFKNANWMGNKPTRASFWGFWMNVLAKMYGVNWEEIKQGKYDVLLDSFLWGNANSIESDTSETVNKGAPGYPFAKEQSKIFDSVKLIQQVFSPNVVILTCSEGEKSSYLGEGFELVETVENRVKVLKSDSLLVFFAPHPNNQRWHLGGAEEYARIMRDLLVKYKMFCPLPTFGQGISEDALKILIRECSCAKMNKYEAISRIALELRRQHSCMSARSLCVDILNKAGHRTDAGTEYTGNGKGPCRLCATAYRRFEQIEPDVADAIAVAFTKDNGFYAYE